MFDGGAATTDDQRDEAGNIKIKFPSHTFSHIPNSLKKMPQLIVAF